MLLGDSITAFRGCRPRRHLANIEVKAAFTVRQAFSGESIDLESAMQDGGRIFYRFCAAFAPAEVRDRLHEVREWLILQGKRTLSPNQ
jgi:hypothetical protein